MKSFAFDDFDKTGHLVADVAKLLTTLHFYIEVSRAEQLRLAPIMNFLIPTRGCCIVFFGIFLSFNHQRMRLFKHSGGVLTS